MRLAMKPSMLVVVLCAAVTSGTVIAGENNVLDHGAKPDGKTLCTAAIQGAIDACAADGGGTVRFPTGIFLTGALVMKSGVTLKIDEGATLLGSRNLEHYYGPPLDPDGRPAGGKRVFRNLIHGEGLHDVAVRGTGTIDGNGSAFRDKTKPRPKAIYLKDCRNIVVENVKLRSAGSWMQHYRSCENLTIRKIDVFNHVSFNNDGLNIDSCTDVTIIRLPGRLGRRRYRAQEPLRAALQERQDHRLHGIQPLQRTEDGHRVGRRFRGYFDRPTAPSSRRGNRK